MSADAAAGVQEGRRVSYVEELTKYMEANAQTDPFKVRAAVVEMVAALSAAASPDIKSLKSMNEVARALDGVCSLHVEQAFVGELRRIPWWRRNKLAATRDTWERDLTEKLHKEAQEDIEAIRWNF